MTKDSKEKLLMAYRAAVAGKFTSVADLLEDVILEVMNSGTKDKNTTVNPYRSVTTPIYEDKDCVITPATNEEATS